MTSVTSPDGRHDALFIADFCPRLGAYLARQHANGYDAVAGRTRYLLWLAAHTDDGALMAYMARAARLPRLTAEEETELAIRLLAGRSAEQQLAEGGDTLAGQARADLERTAEDGGRAGDRLLEANLALVVSISKRYIGRGMPNSDLIRAGRVGLTRAIERYDHTKGYRFTTYATWWIRQAITRALAARFSLSRIPAPQAAGIDELAQTERRMLEALGREPTPEELAAELDPAPV
jgi:RNA polymerase primary sigma factor